MKTKKTNPYEKKQKRQRRITRKQWIAMLSILGVVAILAGIVVMSSLGGGDPHAGHDHGDESTLPSGHYEGDGHDHSHSHSSAADTSTPLRYQSYTNADKTYSYAIYNSKGVELVKLDKLPYAGKKLTDAGMPMVYFQTAEAGFTSGNSIYCDEKNQRVSAAFHGVLGCDGVRVAYCSEDDTKVIVQDLFDKKAYYKEYDLPNVYENGTQTVTNGKLSADKKSVTVTYAVNKEGGTNNHTIKLYE